MPDDLVEDVRLRRVERLRRVPQVLGRVEHPVRERPVEHVERHEPGGRVEPEAAERTEARADLVELRHAVGGQREGFLALQVAADREPLVLRRELAAHGLPDRVLGVRVVHVRHGVAGLPRERRGGDLVPAAAVRVVVRAGVVVREVHGGLAVLVGGDGGVELSFVEHAIRSTPKARATHPPDGSATPRRCDRPGYRAEHGSTRVGRHGGPVPSADATRRAPGCSCWSRPVCSRGAAWTSTRWWRRSSCSGRRPSRGDGPHPSSR